VKTVGKFFGNSGFIFSYFLVIFVLLGKYGNRYEKGYDVTGIDRNTVRLPYRLFLDWPRKFGNFLNFSHCSSRLSRTVHLGWASIFFLLIQRVFKYSNDSNLQNKKLVFKEY
jgi:hypothetical protein